MSLEHHAELLAPIRHYTRYRIVSIHYYNLIHTGSTVPIAFLVSNFASFDTLARPCFHRDRVPYLYFIFTLVPKPKSAVFTLPKSKGSKGETYYESQFFILYTGNPSKEMAKRRGNCKI